jgi:hypothetical protein
VVDADTGAYVPITEMRWGRKTLAFDGYQLRAARVSDFIPQGVREVFELRTRAGLRIRATASHPFRTLDRWTPLRELKAGDRIAVAREIPVFGRMPLPDWEATLLGLMISERPYSTPGHSPTYTTADPALVSLREQTVAAAGLGTANRAHQWLTGHRLNVGAAEKFVPQCVFMAPEASVRLFLQALFSGDGSVYHSGASVCVECHSDSQHLIEDVHHLLLRFGVFSRIRNNMTAIGTRAWRVTITDPEQIQRFAERIGFTAGSLKQCVLDEEVLPTIRLRPACRSHFDTLPQETEGLLPAAARVGGTSLRALNITTNPAQSVGPMWDVVDAIEPAGQAEVFDISVPGLHNFVANGMIVHNSTYARCGIIVNVTPLEPEWEGHVTLEFSNTTPLPAKIYANEGVAQMLFFESDEVCETSYADRGGKYQGQRGVTLPKA